MSRRLFRRSIQRRAIASAAGLVLAGWTLLGSASCSRGGPPESGRPAVAELTYPEAPRDSQVDVYHGIEVADPYRWLEELDSEVTAAWVAAQNALAQPFLQGIRGRDQIQRRLEGLWDYPRYSVPVKEGARYFFERNDGLQDQDVLLVADSLDAEPRVLLDPNGFSADGTVSLSAHVASPDGRLVAYGVSDGGSDWKTWRVLDVASGEPLADELTGIKFSEASWARDSSGFYYSRYPGGADGHPDGAAKVAIYLHAVGTAQDEDRLVYALPEGVRGDPYAEVTEDGRYLVVLLWDGYEANALFYLDLQRADAEITPLRDRWDALYELLGNQGSVLYLKTTADAPRHRVVALDVEGTEPGALRDVVPEAEEALESASLVGGRVVARYVKDARSLVKIFDTDGRLEREVALPGIGTADGFAGKVEDPETFFSFTSFTRPSEIHRYDVATGESSLLHRPEVAIDPDAFETRQVFYRSKDGTRIPMFITHRRGIELDGSNPTLLHGYGGFNVAKTPEYRTWRMVWMEMGGVLAIPNLRGGGEYGEAWHLAGTRLDKQNVFDDFIAAAEWLIEEGYTSSERLAIQGASNGGLLVGAVMTQRPELFGAALPAVGVLDMLRYHTASANARQWGSDLGLSEVEEEFRALYAYSPYHRIQDGACYPPTLITTADHDDRVVPWHSFKFGARLQRAQGCENPVLVRVETRAGHGAGKPTWMRIEEATDALAFLKEMLAMEAPARG